MFTKLLSWSQENYSNLPWRENRSLYTTLVSEIMLQQTTVSTVLNHFQRFLDLYPRVEDLARATEEEVCIAWKGLGYYRRARNLRKAAIDIVEKFDGEIPLDYNELITISGVGDYTANALLSIGADKRALSIDANIERVCSRILGIKSKKGPKLHKILKERFANGDLDLSKNQSYRDLNEALMDLGRVYCQARKASCELCPMKKNCEAFRSTTPLDFPEEHKTKTAVYYELSLLRVVVKKRGRYLGFVKTDKEWLSGQVEHPTFVISCEDKSLKQYPTLKKKVEIEKLKKFKTSITKYKITNYICEMSEEDFLSLSKAKKYQFFSGDSSKVNLATSAIKTIDKL